MKFVVVAVFMAFVLAVGGDSASVLSVTDETVIINGTTDTHANVQLHVPIGEIWAGLAEGKSLINNNFDNIFVFLKLIRKRHYTLLNVTLKLRPN